MGGGQKDDEIKGDELSRFPNFFLSFLFFLSFEKF